ncbi:MAG: hypothetical protein R3D55_20790 [Chloroflexota bacterium]
MSVNCFKGYILRTCLVVLSTSFFILALLQVVHSGAIILSWQKAVIPEKLANAEALVADINNQEILYSIGGEYLSTTVSAKVRYAPLLAGGVPGNWKNASSLPISLRNHTATIFDNMIFVIGGKTNLGEISPTTFYSDRVYCGQLDESGNIDWGNSYEVLPNNTGWVVFHAAVASEEKIYVIGGQRIGGNSSDVWSMIPGQNCNDGLIWKHEGNLPDGISNHAAALVTLASGEQGIYVVGGLRGSVQSNSVQFAPIEPSGDLGAWEPVSLLNDVSGLQRHKVIARDGFLYVIGGSTSFTIDNSLDTVFRAQIGANGTLSPWEKLNALPYPLHSHAIAVSRSGQIYVVGGDESNDLFYQELVYTPLVWFSKSAEPAGVVVPGDQITYTLHYTSNGLRPLTNLTITDEIPANTFLVGPEYSPTTRVLTWTVPFLDVNHSGSVSFTVQVMPPVTAVSHALTPITTTPTVPSIDPGPSCSNNGSGCGCKPRPNCHPTATPSPLATTPAPTSTPTPTPTATKMPVPVINQAWLCEGNWCIYSNQVFNAPYHTYLPAIMR